ncbi:unnamed protein product, partial [Timema podura]|nr:unnamed protein product [Timema podura]
MLSIEATSHVVALAAGFIRMPVSNNWVSFWEKHHSSVDFESKMFVVLLVGCIVLYLFYKLSTARPENFPPVRCLDINAANRSLMHERAVRRHSTIDWTAKYGVIGGMSNIIITMFCPGPPSLPIYGSYWFVLLCNYKKLHKGFHTLARWYNTKLLGLHLGPFPTVVACDYATVKEVFTRPQFNGKLDCFLSQERSMGKTLGLFFTDDKLWIEQRRFTLRHLRDFGFARRFSPQEDVVNREVLDMVAFLSGSTSIQDHDVFKDGCALMPHIFSPAMINCLWSILASDHFPPESHGKLREVGAAAYFFLKEVQPTGGALLLTPWLRHFAPRTFGYTALVKGTGAVTDFIKVAVKEHKQTYLEDDARDFIDEYLKELKKCDSSSTFSGRDFKYY